MCDIAMDLADDAAVFTERKIARTRQDWSCLTCHERIQSGTSCHSYTMIRDGRARTERQCSACNAISSRFTAAHEFTPMPSYLYEAVVVCAEESPDQWAEAISEMSQRGRYPTATPSVPDEASTPDVEC